MYLHMQEPKVDLSSVTTTEKILENLSKELRYRGLFLEDEKGYLSNGNYHLNDSVYTQEELDILLAYNQKLFLQAAEQIKQGYFLINPYSEDGKTVKGDQLKAITRFEADRHMPYARKWFKLPRKDRRQGFLSLMQEEEEKMTFKPFLTAEAISSLQQKEAQSSKAQKRTPEQIEAIYSYGNNILVSASAGSGKTFVMVERIIDKILRGIAVDQLFISTFTVKAAGELKERLEKKISQALQQATHNDLKTYLNEQLLALQTADIGTMDAFTQKLVNQYGYTLGISPTFRIMTDKSEQDLIKNDVFADLLQIT